jgi:hypothetical protein
MTSRSNRSAPANLTPRSDRTVTPDGAFDLWLDRSLKALCESVAAEPLPEALLRAIEADSAKRAAEADNQAPKDHGGDATPAVDPKPISR